MVAGKFVLNNGFDAHAFLADIKAARDAVGEAGEADARHLHSLVNAAQVFAVGGHILIFLGAAFSFGFLSALAGLVGIVGISTARCMRWTIIGHHVSHGGYDKVQKACPDALPKHYRRGAFAVKTLRRLLDWLDWMLPEAWDVEHNKLHHYYLSEDKDPDLVERNFSLLHDMPLPMFLKYASMGFWMVTWKATYYSPNTFKELEQSRPKSWVKNNWPLSRDPILPITVFDFVRCFAESIVSFQMTDAFFWASFALRWWLLVLPMVLLVISPVAPPLALGLAGAWPFETAWQSAAVKAFVCGVLADMLSNAHSFVIIACNHSGADLYRYTTSCKAYSAEWFLRCAYSSANFETGNDFIDGVYGWLNYQVEHHMFPDMTPLQYRKLQPLIKSVCKKHGAMYVQQNALIRTWRMIRCAVGAEKMQVCEAILPPDAKDARAATPKAVEEPALPERALGA